MNIVLGSPDSWVSTPRLHPDEFNFIVLQGRSQILVVEISTLVFSLRYSTTINIQKAVLLMHLREQHLNGSKDIFVTLVVILGYLIRSFIYIITNVVLFFFR